MGNFVIIGFCGKRQSGKSTAAKYFVENYGAHRFSFAGGVKELAKEVWGFTDEQVYGNLKEIEDHKGRVPRECLANLGHGARVILGKNVWVNHCINSIKSHHNRTGSGLYVIDDVRYANEVATIINNGGVSVKLDRVGRAPDRFDNHASETSVDDIPQANFDFIFNTDHKDGLGVFYKKLEVIIHYLERGKNHE